MTPPRPLTPSAHARAQRTVQAEWDVESFSQHDFVRLMERPWFVISPRNSRVAQWNLVILFAMLYVSTITPYEVSVMNGEPHPALRAINYLVDFIFALDLVLQFFVGFWDPVLKAMCYDPCRIARRYSSSWLPLDVVSIFPFDEAAKGNDQLSTLRVVRIVSDTSRRARSRAARSRRRPRPDDRHSPQHTPTGRRHGWQSI
jgi:hypothetical protein